LQNIICAIARLENDYIADWVGYHLAVGFSRIVLFDNRLLAEEPLIDRLRDPVADGRVLILDASDLRAFQLRAYEYAYRAFDFDWCAFIDCDEFITFGGAGGYRNIDDYLRDADAKGFELVKVNWLNFGDNGHVRKGAGSVVERFPQPLPYEHRRAYDFPENFHVKSIVRKGKDISWRLNSHLPACDTLKACGEDLVATDNRHPFRPFTYRNVLIRHYVTKSLEEFVDTKLRRQTADSHLTPYDFDYYFSYNERTAEKEQFIAQYLAGSPA
jgi:hypothetical protein